jgi:hypothetical protein
VRQRAVQMPAPPRSPMIHGCRLITISRPLVPPSRHGQSNVSSRICCDCG